MCWGAQMGSTAGEQQLGTHLQQGYVALGLGWNQKVLVGLGVSVRGPAMLQTEFKSEKYCLVAIIMVNSAPRTLTWPTLWHPLSSRLRVPSQLVQALGKFDLQILGNTENTPRCTETCKHAQTHNPQIQTERWCDMVVHITN